VRCVRCWRLLELLSGRARKEYGGRSVSPPRGIKKYLAQARGGSGNKTGEGPGQHEPGAGTARSGSAQQVQQSKLA